MGHQQYSKQDKITVFQQAKIFLFYILTFTNIYKKEKMEWGWVAGDCS